MTRRLAGGLCDGVGQGGTAAPNRGRRPFMTEMAAGMGQGVRTMKAKYSNICAKDTENDLSS